MENFGAEVMGGHEGLEPPVDRGWRGNSFPRGIIPSET